MKATATTTSNAANARVWHPVCLAPPSCLALVLQHGCCILLSVFCCFLILCFPLIFAILLHTPKHPLRNPAPTPSCNHNMTSSDSSLWLLPPSPPDPSSYSQEEEMSNTGKRNIRLSSKSAAKKPKSSFRIYRCSGASAHKHKSC